MQVSFDSKGRLWWPEKEQMRVVSTPGVQRKTHKTNKKPRHRNKHKAGVDG